MNQLSTFRWSLAEDAHYYRMAGYSAIGIWRRKVEDFGIERSAELLADNGLAVSHLEWAGGFTGSDGQSWKTSVRDANHAILAAATIGAPTLLLFAGGRNCHTDRHALRLLRTALEKLLPKAATHRVCLALKPVHTLLADEWSFQNDLQQAVDFVESFDSPWLKLAVDTYHFPQLATQSDTIGRLAPWTALLQLGDSKRGVSPENYRCRLGEGSVAYSAILGQFVAAGYDGFVDVNMLGAAPSRDYCDLLAHTHADVVQWSTSAPSIV